MHADIVVDDEFEPRQTDALVGQLSELEGQLRVAHVHHDLDRQLGQRVIAQFTDFGLEHAVIDIAGVALGTGDGDQRTTAQALGGITAAHHRRDAEFTRNDCGVAGASAPIGHDG